ncbi:hypothetical protein FACS189487_00430 [Campylobacterota bacterium]|nr:hypothetical protein FACS189487_00430 [Campylobacterota bacterium]
MAQIYFDHYDADDRARFHSDLAEKSDVLLLYHADRIVGFTTYLAYKFVWQDQPLRIVFSGDTVVAQAHWGQQTFTYAWAAQMGRLYRAAPEPLYWFLIVKGHRTYRYLPLIGGEFFPHWRTPHPELEALAQALAQARFGANYDPASGLIHFEHSHGHLKSQFAYPDDRTAQKESVAFFLRRNPNFWQGDELVCLYEMKPENMSAFWRRMFLGAA